jgi:hypothetical protein
MQPRALCLGLLLASIAAIPAAAQDMASGETIRKAVAGNTMRGTLAASGGFEEFYAKDGSIRAADYAGQWSISGNRMCFTYDGEPPSCWSLQLGGANVTFFGKGGEEGSGIILPGNPKNY